MLQQRLSGLLLHPVTLWAATHFERPRPKPSDDSPSYDRLDTWVLKVSIAIPLVVLTILLTVQLLRYLARKLKKPRVARRSSPEPPSREPLPDATKKTISDRADLS